MSPSGSSEFVFLTSTFGDNWQDSVCTWDVKRKTMNQELRQAIVEETAVIDEDLYAVPVYCYFYER